MAYVSQEMKKELAPAIKAICKKYGIKATLSVHNHSTLSLNIKSGKIDFIGNYNENKAKSPEGFGIGSPAEHYVDPNPYWYQESFTGKAKAFLDEIFPALKGPKFFDHTDIMTDYFHCSHYFDVKVGSWNKPYELE